VIADLEVDRDELAGLVAAARADAHDFAGLRLFLCRIRMMIPPAVFSSARCA